MRVTRGGGMQDPGLARLIERFDRDAPLERAHTPPAGWYLDADLHALERRAVFGVHWQAVARVDQLRNPGDQVGGVHAGAPWLVVRGADGVLSAFRGVCRHRAAVLLEGTAHGERVHCPYHGWSYRLDGRLARATGLAGIADFDREACALPALDVIEWGPLVMLRGGGEATSPAARLPEIDAALEARSWGALEFAGRRTWDMRCNWKVFCDNYLDGGLHVPHLHPSLDAQIDMRGYAVWLFGHGSLQTAPAGTDADAAGTARRRIGDGALYAFVHPNLMINRYGPVLDTNLVLPLEVDRCRVIVDVWFEADADERFRAVSLAQTRAIQDEDVAICESVQVGMASGAWERGRYAPAAESAVLHFHRMLAQDLTAPPVPPVPPVPPTSPAAGAAAGRPADRRPRGSA